jgi:hypothetical protein
MAPQELVNLPSECNIVYDPSLEAREPCKGKHFEVIAHDLKGFKLFSVVFTHTGP